MCRATISAVLVSLATAGAFSTGQTTGPATQSISQLKAQEQARLEPWRTYPNAGEKSAADVLSFRKDRGFLAIGSKLPAARRNSVLSIRGMNGTAMYRFTPGMAGDSLFFLERYDFSDADDVDVHETFIQSPTSFQVVQFTEWADRMLSATLMQGPREDGQRQVTLRVQMSGDDDSVSVDVKLSAATFDELRLKHSAEVERYLRPIFRRWGQEQAVFAVDPVLAWQVVADEWRGPEPIAAQVKTLLASMNVDDYRTRQEAQETLSRMGEPAALYLMSIDRATLTGEQNARVDEFLHAYCPVPAQEARRLGADPDFLLDCLYSPDASLDQAALAHLQKAAAGHVTVDLTLTGAARAAAISAAHLKLQETAPPNTRPSP